MINPFTEKYISDTRDSELIEMSLQGDKNALEELIHRHQAWIYNIALRMVWHPQDAEDVTQEILIKAVTRLASFKGSSSFRTWLYRIVVNHVIDMKRTKKEIQHKSFRHYGDDIDAAPDLEIPDPARLPVDINIIVEETRIGCITGMLLCLERKSRIVFTLGAIFGVSDEIGSELLNITRENFRQKLSRSRKKIMNFMNDRCSLFKKDNSCNCLRKTKALIDLGVVQPDNLLFSSGIVKRVKDIAEVKLRQFDDFFEENCRSIYLSDPFFESPDFAEILNDIVERKKFKNIMNLDNQEN